MWGTVAVELVDIVIAGLGDSGTVELCSSGWNPGVPRLVVLQFGEYNLEHQILGLISKTSGPGSRVAYLGHISEIWY